jgi:LEA14-like dessication related protein
LNKAVVKAGLLLALSLGGCATVLERVGLVNCRYSLVKASPQLDLTIPVSRSAIALTFEVKVTNPNPNPVTLDHLVFDLFVNQAKVASGDSKLQASIAAGGEGTIAVESRFTYEELKDTFLTLAETIRRGEATYEIRGTAFYETALGPLAFPVTIKKGEVGQ